MHSDVSATTTHADQEIKGGKRSELLACYSLAYITYKETSASKIKTFTKHVRPHGASALAVRTRPTGESTTRVTTNFDSFDLFDVYNNKASISTTPLLPENFG